MKADDLKLEEIVSFSEGGLNLYGRRLVLHSVNAMAQFRVDLVQMAGIDRARRILTRFGYFAGQADAAAMKRVFTWPSLEEWLRAGPRIQTLHGSVRSVVKRLDVADGKPFRMEVLWHGSAEAEEQLLELGGLEQPGCWILSGYASGYATYCMGRPIYFLEQKCCSQGDRICMAVGMDEAGWGAERKSDLAFFEPEDIDGKIKSLTRELRVKSKEIEKQKQKLQVLEKLPSSAFVEVRSRAFQQVLDLAARVAPFDSSVLITGESGVGKEILARFIHDSSQRKTGPFVAINCGSLPESLLQSELFGHKEGAFTGAIRERMGLFEQARGGTIFLDEIGDISPAVQVNLLRVLQEREVRRVGENKARTIDVRVMAATNRNLEQAVRKEAFREDLFYRLRVFEIRIPPLRDRQEDIIPLARHLVCQLAERLNIPKLRLDGRCMEYLQRYSWPGNIRELQNCLERAAVLSKNGLIVPEGLPPSVVEGDKRAPGEPSASSRSTRRTLAQAEREHIDAVMEATGGNRAQAARILGVSTSTLWRKLKE